MWIIRYVYYGLIFSIPFEAINLGVGLLNLTVSKFAGFVLITLTILQPRLCLKLPPKVFWCFAVYLYAYATWGVALLLAEPESSGLARTLAIGFFRLSQLMVLFWISYNLLQHRTVFRGTIFTLVMACLVLAALVISGVAEEDNRATVGEENPNTVGLILSLGIIAIGGLLYGHQKTDVKLRLALWFCSGLFALAVVHTGSRGSVVALILALSLFLLSRGNIALKIKIGLATFLGVVVLLAATYQVEAVRLRWEKTLTTGNVAHRDVLYPAAVEMIKDQPLIGWGPERNRVELGLRIADGPWDAHNLYLHLLTQVGLLGAIPFFLGLWFCWKAAWRARKTIHGILPLALLAFLLVLNMKGNYVSQKLFWVVLAYSLASGTYAVLPQRSYVHFRHRATTERTTDHTV